MALKQIEVPRRTGMSLVFLRTKNFHQDEEVNRRNDSSEGYIMTPEFLQQGPRVNADADAYVETLQTIVKPLWIDSVANGGRPYVFQQDLTLSHEPSKTQN
ncbi:hypothetical protein ACTXT7_012046 [Hymenolepis weldensis]